MSKLRIPKRNYAFVDGSFNPKTNVYGCGGFLVDQLGKQHTIQANGRDPTLISMRNVAGELLGSKMAIIKALELGMKKLTIFYDYDGVANWPTGKWKCKKPATKNYAEFVAAAMATGLQLYFQHAKGHAGIPGNEEADRLAKEAVGIIIKKGE